MKNPSHLPGMAGLHVVESILRAPLNWTKLRKLNQRNELNYRPGMGFWPPTRLLPGEGVCGSMSETFLRAKIRFSPRLPFNSDLAIPVGNSSRPRIHWTIEATGIKLVNIQLRLGSCHVRIRSKTSRIVPRCPHGLRSFGCAGD
jgi:hypothetical protein